MRLFWLPVIIILIFLSGLGATVFKAKSNIQKFIPSPSITTVTTTQERVLGSIFINENYEIMLRVPNSSISAVAVRVSYDLGNQKISKPTLIINQELINQNWVYPIKEVVLDDSGGMLKIDLAAVYISPEGYSLADEIKLATLDFGDDKPNVSRFKFHQDETKVITKSGEEVRL